MKTNKKEDFGIELPQFSPFDLILGEARYILLYDEIDEFSAKEVNTKLIAMSIKNPRKPILLEICSGGGSVGHGITIMNTIPNTTARGRLIIWNATPRNSIPIFTSIIAPILNCGSLISDVNSEKPV